MAEDSINTSLTPEIIEPDGGNLSSSEGEKGAPNGGQNKHPGYRRFSTGSYHYGGDARRKSMGKLTFTNNGQNILPHHIRASTGSFHDVVNSGRNSPGKPNSPNSGKSVTPHYLRASTGSCHDFCKYGRKHVVEVKARRPIPKRVTTHPLDMQNPTDSGVQAERKTTKVLKPKHSSISKTLAPDSPRILKQEVSSPSKKVEVPSRQASLNEKKDNFSGKRTPVKPKIMTAKSLSSPDTSGGLNGRRNNEIKIAGKKTGTSKAAVNKGLASPAASFSPKPSINRVMSLNVKKYKSMKLLSSLEDQNRFRKAEPKQPNSEEVPEKTLHVVKVETEKKVLESTQNDSTIHSPPSPSPSLSSPKFSSLPKSPALSFNEEEAQEEFEYTDCQADPNSENVPEKTLHVVKVETENKVLESTQNGSTIHSPPSPSPSPSLSSPKFSSPPKSPALSFHEEEAQEEFEYTDSQADESDDSISENSETVNLHEVEISDGNCNRAPRKAGAGLSENKDCTPMKLKFRRGKVVDLQSENGGPRRLRFRRGRVLGGTQDSKANVQRRSFKKRVVDDETNGTNADSAKVVLRHQDVQGKKDEQGLFNNVIEETASKLVESRKSKVKALVGAFETVISLQDTKPSTQTVT